MNEFDIRIKSISVVYRWRKNEFLWNFDEEYLNLLKIVTGWKELKEDMEISSIKIYVNEDYIQEDYSRRLSMKNILKKTI